MTRTRSDSKLYKLAAGDGINTTTPTTDDDADGPRSIDMVQCGGGGIVFSTTLNTDCSQVQTALEYNVSVAWRLNGQDTGLTCTSKRS